MAGRVEICAILAAKAEIHDLDIAVIPQIQHILEQEDKLLKQVLEEMGLDSDGNEAEGE